MRAMSAVAMPTVHEDVQQRAEEEEKKRQISEHMHAVFIEEQERGDCQEADGYQSRPRVPEAGRASIGGPSRFGVGRRRCWWRVQMFIQGHDRILLSP